MKTKILIGILFLLGVAFLLYPLVSDYINEIRQAEVVENYSASVDQLEQEELKKEWKKAKEYNKNLQATVIIDPFTEKMNQELEEAYKNILNIDGSMATLKIPKIKVELPVYHGTGDETLRKGVGHLENTSLPIGGEGTHAVLSGHRGLPESKLFTDLDKLEEGDLFYIQVLNKTLAYEVDQIRVVDPHVTEDLQIERGQDYVTLLTCTPYGINTHRLLVRGSRTEFNKEEQIPILQREQEHKKIPWQRVLLFAAVILIAVVFFYKLLFGNRRKAGRRDR